MASAGHSGPCDSTGDSRGFTFGSQAPAEELRSRESSRCGEAIDGQKPPPKSCGGAPQPWVGAGWRAGLWRNRLVTLEVRGRRTGRVMTFPLMVADYQNGR